MGCWNGTCFVTGLAIEYESPVRFFLLSEQAGKTPSGGYSGNVDRWCPTTLPLQGIYDDYGGVKRYTINQIQEADFQHLKSQWVNPPEDDQWRSHKEGSRENLSWDGLIHNVERGIAKIEPSYHLRTSRLMASKKLQKSTANISDPMRLGMCMVHEPVYQAMVSEMQKRTVWGDTDLFGESLMKNLTKAKEILEVQDSDQDHFFETHRGLEEIRRDLMIEIPLSRGIGLWCLKDADEKSTQDFADFLCFDRALDLMRKHYTPTGGKGSQDVEKDLHKAVMKSSKEILDGGQWDMGIP